MILRINAHTFRQLIRARSLTLAISFIGVAILSTLVIPKFVFESYERSTIESAANALLAFQQAYKSEFGVYCVDQSLIRKSALKLEEIEYVLSRSELPAIANISLVKENDPFVSETKFNIWILLKSEKYRRISVWKVTPDPMTVKLYSNDLPR